MDEVIFSPRAYCKIIMHAAKYPHCAINGVLLARDVKNDDRKKTIVYVDAIPLFHVCLNVTPMAEIALSLIDQLAESTGLIVAGYYIANENINDLSIDKPSLRIADIINEKCKLSSLILIDNKLVTLDHTEPAICGFYNSEGKWKSMDKNKLVVMDDILDRTSSLLVKKVFYELVDFDNHLDNISLDWKNVSLNQNISQGWPDESKEL